ncbi:decaprenyl-diphosphate synthase subunit [Nesidiocoris tenuis]|uniref:Decaprenyl-diphosphate synthase subunit n=1 Tax=Nesidiocoris tenuis TaxID=355587 RepID=A0ABN7AYM7_9HEMI|nr:decaprenyl-diphosphate synthase subunit [Nesidiocoris tenuis]
MASFASSRLCVRALETLCLLPSRNLFVRKKTTAVTTFVRTKSSRSPVISGLGISFQENEGCRTLSTQHPGPGSVSVPQYETIDPYALTEDDLKIVHHDIRQELLRNTSSEELQRISTYYFDGQGKSIRPMIVLLMSRALNYHMNHKSGLTRSQVNMAMVTEMIHTASLVHDDVIDSSDFRRGKPSINAIWSQKKVAMAGDFIIAVVSKILANMKNCDVTSTIAQALSDLVQGEFMQLGSKETENERFAHYLTKTYRKTASLMANSLKSRSK